MSSYNSCYNKFSVYTSGSFTPIISPTPVETQSFVFKQFPNSHVFDQSAYSQYKQDNTPDIPRRRPSCGYKIASETSCSGLGSY